MNNSKVKRKYVFVTWDPLYERVVCVHDKLEDTCKKCESIRRKRWKENSFYFLNTSKFLIK
jgi:hypothetical protein